MRTLPIALLVAAVPLSGAHAGIWAWGCQGQLGDEQVIFNRYNMAIFKPGKQPLGDLKRLTDNEIKTPAGMAVDKYEPQNGNSGFEDRTIEFLGKDDEKRKIVLVEKSSRKLSHRHKNIGGRDEDTDTYRKVFSFTRANEPARDITMQCIEYQLSTCGGRCK
jgi:hypothetical protein